MFLQINECDVQASKSTTDFDSELTNAMNRANAMGVDALIYDYAPIPFSPTDEMISPLVFGTRNMPSNMASEWLGQGLHQQDPVQRVALRSAHPIYWSYHFEEESVLTPKAQGQVADYLRDCNLARGVTVPVHIPNAGTATITAVWNKKPQKNKNEPSLIANLMLFAHQTHERLSNCNSSNMSVSESVSLTPRETQCIRLCARGLSDKQAAFEIDRSTSTVVMHLQSAMRKLGARNRAQTIAHAAHYGILN